jgi:hypothetical protein
MLRVINNVPQLLNALGHGDPHAPSRLLPLAYEGLRRLVGQRMAQEQPDQTLQPTALVHEKYMRQGPMTWKATCFARPYRRFVGGSPWKILPSNAAKVTLTFNDFHDRQTSRLAPACSILDAQTM